MHLMVMSLGRPRALLTWVGHPGKHCRHAACNGRQNFPLSVKLNNKPLILNIKKSWHDF